MWRDYGLAKARVDGAAAGGRVDSRAVFANNELDLSSVEVYGFDYDYTLAVYTKQLNRFIYACALNNLINDANYPKELLSIPHDPAFAIRGLHFDPRWCTLMKLDAFSRIQPDTLYRGKMPLSDEDVRRLYGGYTIPNHLLANGTPSSGAVLTQLNDLFSLPEMGLLTTAVEYFEHARIDFDTHSLFTDVKAAVAAVHVRGQMYRAVADNMVKYVHTNDGLADFLRRLRAAGKLLFLVTNSPFGFMSAYAGLRFLVGNQWRDLFHYVVVRANKPRFFTDRAMPLRQYDESSATLAWRRVHQLDKHVVYAGGNLREFVRKSELAGKKVLYFGDHIYSDLAEPMLSLGWHTGAVVPELECEIETQNSETFDSLLRSELLLGRLVERWQHSARQHADSRHVLAAWLHEKDALRQRCKALFNPRFGSIFRTFQSPTYFSRRLMRLADVYTSRLPNLLQYDLEHIFYPRRYALPHEAEPAHLVDRQLFADD